MKTRILLVEDDPALRKLLKEALPESIFIIDIAETGREGLDMIVKRKPDLILLDWNLPDLNGFEVCKYIKQNKDCAHIPVIMVTAYSELNRKVSALDVGADDYITKPFSVRELLARARAVLRRADEMTGKTYEDDQLQIDFDDIRVICRGQKIKLTNKEFSLLSALARSADRVITRQQLLDNVWGYSYYGDARTLDVHIRRLRQKLGECGDCIETVVGVGYRFVGCANRP
jgi:DNA-binding response OmpR family regulator